MVINFLNMIDDIKEFLDKPPALNFKQDEDSGSNTDDRETLIEMSKELDFESSEPMDEWYQFNY